MNRTKDIQISDPQNVHWFCLTWHLFCTVLHQVCAEYTQTLYLETPIITYKLNSLIYASLYFIVNTINLQNYPLFASLIFSVVIYQSSTIKAFQRGTKQKLYNVND